MLVTVRYFAAARAAAGTEIRDVDGCTRHDHRRRWSTRLRARGDGLATVLARCSYLCDGVAVRDTRPRWCDRADYRCATALRGWIVIYVT